MKKWEALACIIVTIILSAIFLTSCSFPNRTPKEKPYVTKGILYLDLKEIPVKDIVYIEIVKDPVVYIIIHYKNGMYSLPYHEYLIIARNL